MLSPNSKENTAFRIALAFAKATRLEDYLRRGGHRLGALGILLQRQSYPDVVGEAQEIVELCLKALLRHFHIEVPRIHDVGDV